MKKYFLCCLVILFIFAVLFTPSCKTVVWDFAGNWTVVVTFPSWGGWTYTEFLSFTGGDDAGSVFGLTMDGFTVALTGTFTKTGDYTITFRFELLNAKDYTWEFTGTSTEGSPGIMTGTGIFTEDGAPTSFTFTGTKI